MELSKIEPYWLLAAVVAVLDISGQTAVLNRRGLRGPPEQFEVVDDLVVDGTTLISRAQLSSAHVAEARPLALNNKGGALKPKLGDLRLSSGLRVSVDGGSHGTTAA